MKPLVAANWKMHGDSHWTSKLSEFNSLIPMSEREQVDVLICPTALHVKSMTNNNFGIEIGAQNCHWEEKGAHTGEISAAQIVQCGAGFVILGHSERRAAGETSDQVRMKAISALRAGLTPIICVGETLEERESDKAHDVVGKQLAESCPNETSSGNLVIAYEPVWAIGTGKTATVNDIESMHAFIRVEMGGGTRILYGGSVKPANAVEIFAADNVNGALIGGAGLEMSSLAEITKAAMKPFGAET